MSNALSSSLRNIFFRTDETGRYRRRIYLINKQSQYRMAGEFAIVMLVGALLSLVNVHFVSVLSYYGSIGVTLFNLLPVDSQPFLWAVVGVLIILSIGIVLLFSVFFSHRVAGPGYRIVKSLDAMTQGDLTMRIRLRKKDHLHDIAEGINHLVANWCETLDETAGEIRALKGQVGQLDEAALLDKLSSLQDTLARGNRATS